MLSVGLQTEPGHVTSEPGMGESGNELRVGDGSPRLPSSQKEL